jgi:hypothetical protein
MRYPPLHSLQSKHSDTTWHPYHTQAHMTLDSHSSCPTAPQAGGGYWAPADPGPLPLLGLVQMLLLGLDQMLLLGLDQMLLLGLGQMLEVLLALSRLPLGRIARGCCLVVFCLAQMLAGQIGSLLLRPALSHRHTLPGTHCHRSCRCCLHPHNAKQVINVGFNPLHSCSPTY